MTPLDRSHLHLAYALTWIIQLAYAAYVVFRYRRSRNAERSIDADSSLNR